MSLATVDFIETTKTRITTDGIYTYTDGEIKNSYTDFGLILTTKEIGFPEVKTEQVDIPGMNGLLDLSEAITGKPTYRNREITLTFSVIDKSGTNHGWPLAKWNEYLADFAKFVHGKLMKIRINNWDSILCYVGRVSIDTFTSDRRIGTLSVICDCDPYKVLAQQTQQTVSLVAGGSMSYSFNLPAGNTVLSFGIRTSDPCLISIGGLMDQTIHANTWWKAPNDGNYQFSRSNPQAINYFFLTGLSDVEYPENTTMEMVIVMGDM